jgi:aldehyde dehydrogenase (NAD+)
MCNTETLVLMRTDTYDSYAEFFPTSPQDTADFARIISPGHFKRVRGLLENTGGKVIIGGAEKCQETTKYIAPSIITDCEGSDSLMSE